MQQAQNQIPKTEGNNISATFEEKMEQVERGAKIYDQLDKDALVFLNQNATILAADWESIIVCKTCGKTYHIDLYHGGRLHIGLALNRLLKHFIKEHGYVDSSYCGLMKLHLIRKYHSCVNYIKMIDEVKYKELEA